MNIIRIGSRGSRLALWQAHWVETELQRYGFASQIIIIGTSGDRDRRQPIAEIGLEGVFTKEIQRALLDGTIDLAVHSLKDLPTETVEGLECVASPQRGPYRDAFVSVKADSLDVLPDGSRIGTGSIRRKAQLLSQYGERFQMIDIRGNVETRLKKLHTGDYDAMILAEAGLVRLGLQEQIASLLEPSLFLPAVGQGALGIEVRSEDTETLSEVIDCLNDLPTYAAVTAERSLLRSLRGGCLAPIAAYCSSESQPKRPAELLSDTGGNTPSLTVRLNLTARVLSPDGQQRLETSQNCTIDFSQDISDIRDIAERLGKNSADTLFAAGADTLLGR